MSTQDNLESLSNSELRAKCLENGLPNVPITDTSRKLLLNRLRKVLDGGGKPDNKSKSRRETIHVTTKQKTIKQTEANKIVTESPKKTRTINNRRATIAAPIVEQEVTVDPIVRDIPIQVQSVTQRRLTGRTTPISQLQRVTPATTVKRKAAAIEEDSEDDIILLDETRSADVARYSRSPSLSKSVTVTTSYQHVKAPSVINDDDESETEEDDDEEENFLPQTQSTISSYRTSTYETSRPTNNMPLPRETQSNYTQRISATRPLLSTAPTTHFSKTFENSLGSNISKRYTTSGYNKPLTTTTTSSYLLNSENNEQIDNVDVDAPYLSDFARRLSRLKAEPIDGVIGSPLKKDTSQNRELPQRYYSAAIGGRRSYVQKDSIADSFRKFWWAFDRKYNLRQNLMIVAIILTIIFIYIFFFN